MGAWVILMFRGIRFIFAVQANGSLREVSARLIHRSVEDRICSDPRARGGTGGTMSAAERHVSDIGASGRPVATAGPTRCTGSALLHDDHPLGLAGPRANASACVRGK